jgi:hypothetical protein
MSTTSPPSVADDATPTNASRTIDEMVPTTELKLPLSKRLKLEEACDPVALQQKADALLKDLEADKTYIGMTISMFGMSHDGLTLSCLIQVRSNLWIPMSFADFFKSMSVSGTVLES